MYNIGELCDGIAKIELAAFEAYITKGETRSTSNFIFDAEQEGYAKRTADIAKAHLKHVGYSVTSEMKNIETPIKKQNDQGEEVEEMQPQLQVDFVVEAPDNNLGEFFYNRLRALTGFCLELPK